MKNSLRYQAAKLAMGKLNADEIKATIHKLVEDDFYLDEFLDALEPSRPRMDEVLPAFLAAISHQGFVLPNREQAVWQLIEHHLRVVDSGAASPLSQLELLIADVYWDYDFHTATKEFLGDSHGIEHLVGLYWSADALRVNTQGIGCNEKHGEEVWAELNHQIATKSKRWLNSHQIL
jgi:hypothetical protein